MSVHDRPNSEQSKQELWNAFRGVLSSSRQGSPLQQISHEGDLPLSFAQQRFWLLYQLEPDSSAYNECVAFLRLKGSLNVVALEQSLNEIRHRHEILQTTFASVNGQPIQRIAPYAPVALSVIDIQEFPHSQREAIAQQHVIEAAQQPFNLEQGPLLRVKLLRLKEEEYVFLVTIHHIIYDGWSHGVFIQELSELYKAFSNNNLSPLPELPIQYADFAQWQRQWLQGKILQSQLDYWKQQLSGSLPVLHLSVDHLQPLIQTYQGATHSRILPKALIDALQSLSESEDATLFMILLAAFKALLYRYTGQEDILIGSPIANRNRREISGLIGCFINTLVLRTDLSNHPTFRELLGRVRSVALAALAHQDLPFERLVEALQPERDLSRSPLFQVMFVFQNAPASSLELEGLTLSPLPVENKTAKFNLTLALEPTPQGLMAAWEYNTDLFDASMIERMAGHFQILLEGIVAQPQQRISELPLLTAAEQHQLLVEWNDTQADYPLGQCVHELFEMQVQRTSDAVAVVDGNQQLTYHQLNSRANQLAQYLQSVGVKADALVGLCVERSLEMVVGLLGILKAGGAYVPLDPNYPQERLSDMLQDAAVSVLLTQQQLVESLPSHQANVVCLDSQWEDISTQSQENPASEVSATHLAYVIYTSGSTGKPKGIAMQHHSLINLIAWQMENGMVDSKAKTLQFAPVSFDVSFQEIFSTWCGGGTLVLISEEIRRDAQALLRLLVEAEIERLFLPVVALQQLAQVADGSPYPLTNLREIITAGEPLQITPALISFFNNFPGCVLHNHYGPSETHVVTAFTLKGFANDWPAIPPIGRPIANTQIYILGDNLRPVPTGVPGELYIGGAGVARGYFNRPDLTQEKFIPDPFSSPFQLQSRLYKTGDLARYLADGNIQFLGRSDRQIKMRGFRIEPGEIETVLSTHPQVQQAVVVVREDNPANKRLVAYLVSDQGSLSSSQLRDFLKQKLPEYMIPSAFVMLEAMPLTPSGKLDRKALRAPDEELSREDNVVLPRTPTEEAIAHSFTTVLGLQQISIHDNFFEMGGHSLLATQVISRLRETFSLELPLRHLFEFPTVAQLSQALSAFQQTRVDLTIKSPEDIKNLEFTITPAQRTSNQFPLSFTQERLWFLDQLEGKSNKYNISIAFQVQGNLNIAVLEQALAALIQRHEILRTRFTITNGTPVQVVDADTNFTLSVVDLQEFPKDQRFDQMQQKVRQELETPFDLAKSHSVRVTLLQVTAEAFVLLVSMHHIVADGWSIDIFIQELLTLYPAFLSNRSSPLPNLPIQYADFAVWQRQWWSAERLQTQLDYWKQQLSHAPPLLELPSDRPRPSVQTFRGNSLSFMLNPELSNQLQTLSRNTDTTLFMTLLAAFATLLYRYSAQEDISIGSPIAHRNHSEIEPLIGSFINTLVLRIRIQDNPNFAELLTQVRQVALAAYEHQDAPFEKIVEALQPERNLSHNPLFQVLFVWRNAPEQTVKLPDLTLTPFNLNSVTSKFDLTLSVAQTKQGLQGYWEYSVDLFDEDTIARMNQHFQTLLCEIVTNPQLPVNKLPLLPATERQRLLDWNNIQTEYSQDQCIHQLFELQVEKTPFAVAVVFEDQQLTYFELNKKANCLAHYLQKLGVGPETIVGLCVERSTDLIVGLLGILKAGGAYLPLDPALPTQNLALRLQEGQVSLVISQASFADRFEQITVVCLDTDWNTILAQPDTNPIALVTPENLIYVLYTSGSTGRPKGVAVEHRQLLNYFYGILERLNLPTGASFATVSTFAADLGNTVIFPALCTGGCLHIISYECATNPTALANYCHSHPIDCLKIVPSHLAALLAGVPSGRILPRQCLVLGGETATWELIEQIQQYAECRILNHYGPTEATVGVLTYPVQMRDPKSATVPLGRSFPNCQIYLLDPYGQPTPVGVPGEISIGGDSLARGYLNQPDLTAERFIPNPLSDVPLARLYKTGDLARYLPDGNIEYLGRIDRQVKIRGFRIELEEIEAALSQHPDVLQTAVIVREDVRGDKRLVAYIVPQEPAPPVSELRYFLTEKLPEYMIPSTFVLLERLPLTPTGKIDRHALPTPDTPQPQISFVAPRSALEHRLAQIWSEILNVQPVGIKDNFFELGGHSLMAVRLMVKLEQEFKATLPIATLFQFPTLEDLANHLGTDRTAPSSFCLVPVQPKGTKPPLFCIHPVGGDVLCYANLAHHLGDTQPVWALRSQGIEGECTPLTRIKDMAAAYISALQTIQPQGSYQLAGWSMGGAIAFEMAAQLVASGQKVSLLALIDSYAPVRQVKAPQAGEEAMLLADWVKNLSGANLAKSISVEQLRLLEPQEQFNYVLEQAKSNGLLPEEIGQKQARLLFQIFKVNVLSWHSYLPQPYPGRITLFCASETLEEDNQYPAQAWRELATGDMEMHTIAGNHFSIIKTQALAELIKADLAHH